MLILPLSIPAVVVVVFATRTIVASARSWSPPAPAPAPHAALPREAANHGRLDPARAAIGAAVVGTVGGIRAFQMMQRKNGQLETRLERESQLLRDGRERSAEMQRLKASLRQKEALIGNLRSSVSTKLLGSIFNDSATVSPMEVNRTSFPALLRSILRAIALAHFVSFDLELSGITARIQRLYEYEQVPADVRLRDEHLQANASLPTTTVDLIFLLHVAADVRQQHILPPGARRRVHEAADAGMKTCSTVSTSSPAGWNDIVHRSIDRLGRDRATTAARCPLPSPALHTTGGGGGGCQTSAERDAQLRRALDENHRGGPHRPLTLVVHRVRHTVRRVAHGVQAWQRAAWPAHALGTAIRIRPTAAHFQNAEWGLVKALERRRSARRTRLPPMREWEKSRDGQRVVRVRCGAVLC
ncbi:MAG: hypothetical protein M1826_003241 [Phylliscum demangeonii]|nr:MAG: hypothetical protein M1826_003241 [Phylliscum demangeonii]